MKMKQVHLMYDPMKDSVCLVHFISDKPVDAQDRSAEFVRASIKWLEEMESGWSLKKRWWTRICGWVGISAKYTRKITDSRGNSYSISMKQTKSIKETN